MNTREKASDKRDWSLSANGNKYIDHNGLLKNLTKQIKESSSSVIGIAGRRGVGKSSLAQKILNNLGAEGSFTLLVHSPTKYDPQEYLATLFQAVCQEVINRADSNRTHIRNVKRLRKIAIDHLEDIRFQITHTSSAEVGFSFSRLKTKSKFRKSFATRPLTLPSLATRFAEFLEEIGKVYSNSHALAPVVICLDELDKIEESKDFEAMLRGIKGVFGKSNVHFLLTVSEDTLTKFSEERQLRRGILESALGYIVLLDRIDLESTDKIVNLMYCESDFREKEYDISTQLLWLFGNAIPREIKRNALVCFENDLPPKTTDSKKIWHRLMNTRMDDFKYWAKHTGCKNEIRVRFLECLEESIQILEKDNSGANFDLNWVIDFVAPWLQLYDFVESQKSTESSNQTSFDFFGAIIEIVLGASALAYVVNDKRKMSSHSLIEIFEFVDTSPQFAWKKVKKHLDDIEIRKITSPSSTN